MPSLAVGGMNCEHCRKAVLQAVRGLPGVGEAQVDLMKGLLSWSGHEADQEAIKKAVQDAGYEVKGEVNAS